MSDGIIRLSPEEFNAALTLIGRGKTAAETHLPPPIPEHNSTFPSVLKPFELLTQMLSVLDTYHKHLEKDIEVCREVGQEFINVDEKLKNEFNVE